MAATSTRLGEAATAASEAVSEAVNTTTDYVAKATDRVRDDFGTTERRAREIIAEYPLTCFFGAIVAGYLVGRIATRW